MSPEEYIERFVASKQLKLDGNGNPTGIMIPVIAVPTKQAKPRKGAGMIPDLPARLDPDGDPLVRLIPKTQIKEYLLLGYQPYKPAKPPKGVTASADTPKEKKGPFGRPIKKTVTDDLDSDQQGDGAEL